MKSSSFILLLSALVPLSLGCAAAQGVGPDGSGGNSTTSGSTTSGSTTSGSTTSGSTTSGSTTSGGGAPGSGGVSGSGGTRTGAQPPAGVEWGTHCNFPNTLNAEVDTLYTAWRAIHYTGGRIARDSADGNDTVSEGIGYGMLMAVYMNDQPMLTALWNYAKSHMNQNGFMNWKISSSGGTVGQNGATDADEDMAWALLMAGRRWGGSFGTDANNLIAKILQNEVDSGDVLKPGDQFGGWGHMNPSYLAPAYYREWAKQNSRWNSILTKSYDLLGLCSNGTTGLTGDWCDNGTPNGPYGEEAFRTPWRVAMDYCWNGEPKALAYLTKLATTLQPKTSGGIPAKMDIATAKATSDGAYLNMGSVASAGLAASGLTDAKFVRFAQDCYNKSIMAADTSYYHGALTILGSMMMNFRWIKY